MDDALRARVEADGFAIVPSVISDQECDRLVGALRDGGHAIRNLLEVVPEVAVLARSPSIRSIANAILGPDCFVVRGLFFDKTPDANWKVPWHQDLTIAVRGRIEVAGFGPWSEKAGIPHVRPHAAILGRMLAIRLHLDPCGAGNGPLRVLPGTHAGGILDEDAISRRRREVEEQVLTARRGAAILMRPLLLHASSPASAPCHRRVVHLEFAGADLPGGLEWHGRW